MKCYPCLAHSGFFRFLLRTSFPNPKLYLFTLYPQLNLNTPWFVALCLILKNKTNKKTTKTAGTAIQYQIKEVQTTTPGNWDT